jgi:hypothetical protein
MDINELHRSLHEAYDAKKKTHVLYHFGRKRQKTTTLIPRPFMNLSQIA